MPKDNRWLVAIFRIIKNIAAVAAGISILVCLSVLVVELSRFRQLWLI